MFERLKKFFNPEPPKNLYITSEEMINAVKRWELKDDKTERYTSTVGIMLGALRRKNGFTIDELANAAGLSKEDIIDTELGLRHLYEIAQDAEKLEKALNLPKGEVGKILLKGNEKR